MNSTKSSKKLYVKLPFVEHDECQEVYEGHKTLNDNQVRQFLKSKLFIIDVINQIADVRGWWIW